MKIGIDISQIAYPGTGVASYTGNLVKGLQSLDQKNEYRLLGYSFRGQKYFRDYKTKIFPLPQTAMELLWNQWHALPVETFLGPLDVFHSSDWIQPPSKAKKVTTVHDLIVYKYPQWSHPKIVETQKRRMEWVKKEVDLIMADSEATKNDLTEILKIDPTKIRVIYLAAGNEFRIKKNGEIRGIREKYHFDRDYILMVGAREPRKNLSRAIEAFSKLETSDTDLVIAGKYGWGENEMNNEQLKMKNIKTLGYVPQEDLPALYSGAKMFVYPSLYEGFGVPVLEAMGCGTPVITSNLSSLPEVGGTAAVYVDPNNPEDIAAKMDTVLRLKTAERNSLIKKSLTQAGKFSWEKTVRETVRVYEELA